VLGIWGWGGCGRWCGLNKSVFSEHFTSKLKTKNCKVLKVN
jgi:hypothetical protein